MGCPDASRVSGLMRDVQVHSCPAEPVVSVEASRDLVRGVLLLVVERVEPCSALALGPFSHVCLLGSGWARWLQRGEPNFRGSQRPSQFNTATKAAALNQSLAPSLIGGGHGRPWRVGTVQCLFSDDSASQASHSTKRLDSRGTMHCASRVDPATSEDGDHQRQRERQRIRGYGCLSSWSIRWAIIVARLILLRSIMSRLRADSRREFLTRGFDHQP